jgi:hypothetical protein
MSVIRIRKFDPKTIQEGRILFIIGKRNTGKSVLMKDLLSHMPVPDYALAMAPTEDSLNVFRSFLPESCIFDHFSQEKLERCVALQRELVNRGKKRTVLILLDDCMYEKGLFTKSNAIRSIFFNGRHDHISFMCAAQYMMDVPAALRAQIDYLICTRENILTNRQKLYKFYFGAFPSFASFESSFSACTQDFKCIVLDNTVSSTASPTDCVMWYKASMNVPPFKLCRSVHWRFARKYTLTDAMVRAAQAKQFEIETATAEATALAEQQVRMGEGGGVGGVGGVGKRAASGKVTVVQTEDEHGNVMTSTA